MQTRIIEQIVNSMSAQDSNVRISSELALKPYEKQPDFLLELINHL